MNIYRLLLVLAVLASSAALRAQFTATFSFAGTVGNVASLAYNGTPVTGLTVSSLAKSGGVTTSSSTGNSRASNWVLDPSGPTFSLTGSIDTGDYYEVTFTPTSGYTLSLTAIDFGIGRSATGPRQAGWASDVNYASLLTVGTAHSSLTNSAGALTMTDVSAGYTGNSIALSGGNYTDLSGSRTFRFYMWNSEGAAGTGGLQGDLSFNGTLSAIPEPSTYAAIFGTLALVGTVWHRRRQRKVG